MAGSGQQAGRTKEARTNSDEDAGMEGVVVGHKGHNEYA